MDIYVNERRSNIPMNDNSVYNVINKYIENNRNIFFIISTEQEKKYSLDINNLIYNEILHRIPSSVTPNCIMDSYKAYFIDAGKYLYLLKEKDREGYFNILPKFSVIVPDDLVENKYKYIVDLEDASVEHVECPNCGAIVSKNHSVYKKHNCCISCAFEFEKRTT